MERNRWSLVAAMGLTVYMAALDLSIVTVALPSIEDHFGTQPALTEWVALSYMLPLIALVLPGGRWLDQVGKRAAVVFAVGGFAATSALAGAAPSIVWLIGARIAQGAFGAVMLASVAPLATTAVRPGARGRAMSVVATLGPLGAVSGPAAGGLLVATLGWPAIFYVNIPVSLVIIGVAVRTMERDGPLRAPDRTWLAEAGLVGGAAFAILLALSLAPSDGPAWLAVALAAVPLLLAWWRLPARRPVTDLLATPGMSGLHAAILLFATAVMAAQFLAPFFLQRVAEVSPGTTGLTVLALPLSMAAIGPIGGVIADRWGTRPAALAGGVTVAAGLLLIAPMGEAWGPADLAWRLALIGVGGGLFAGPVQARAMATAPPQLLGTTGASTNLARQLGFALGPAAATASWALSGYSLDGMRAGMALSAVAGALAVASLAIRRRNAVRKEVVAS